MEKQKSQIRDLEQRIKYKNQELREAESQPGKFGKEHKLKASLGCWSSIALYLLLLIGFYVGIAAESFVLGLIIDVIIAAGIVFFQNEKTKQSVNEYIEQSIQPEINNLQAEIKRIQQSKYGDNR